MRLIIRILFFVQFVVLSASATIYNVTDYGVKGDSVTYNTLKINQLIQLAAQKGGGTIYFPAGNYLSCMIKLRSNITLHFDKGAVLIAAKSNGTAGYGEEEPGTDNNPYIDFAHNHWSNSLIYGRDLKNIAIVGQGMLWGRDNNRTQKGRDADAPTGFLYSTGNKCIGLVNCKNVLIRDLTFYKAGHFTFKTTGVENLTIDNLTIDTYRDGSSIDCCKDVKMSNCRINAPQDDGIVLKSTYALGYNKPTENVVITNCIITANPCGSLLGMPLMEPHRPDLGRIKFGTESNGGFKNIVVSNCVLDNSCGITMETVDGGDLENITFSNIVMRNVYDTPFFIRLAARLRAPEGTKVGNCRRITITNLTAYNACIRDFRAGMIMGIPNHSIEDVEMSNIKIYFKGGGAADLINTKVGEQEKDYPDPEMWKKLPAYGFYIRHAKNVKLSNISLYTLSPDARPAFYIEDVENIRIDNVDMQTKNAKEPLMILKDVRNISVSRTKDIVDFVSPEVKSNVILK